MTDVYWCRCARNRNFGDVLGPTLIEHFTGRPVTWKRPERASMVAVGSIVEHIPDGWSGTVAGIGAAHARTRRDLTNSDVRVLRGPLTRERVEVRGEPVLGDPGILAPDLVPELPGITHDVGLITHYADDTTSVPAGALRIDVTAPVRTVIEQAARCARIVSSSLHGLILADALHRPRMWVTYPKVQGDGFKFHDYGEAFGMDIQPRRWELAPADVVDERAERLREVFRCL